MWASSEVDVQALVGSERCLSWRAVESREGFQMTQGFRAGLLGGEWRCFALTFSEEAVRKACFDGKIIRWFPTMSI